MVDSMDFHSGHSLSSIVITFQHSDAMEFGSPEVTSAELLTHSEAAFVENDSAHGRWEENSPPLSCGIRLRVRGLRSSPSREKPRWRQSRDKHKYTMAFRIMKAEYLESQRNGRSAVIYNIRLRLKYSKS
jgi:hypothetical protein